MAITVAKNKDRVYRRCISILQQPAGESNARDYVGRAKEPRIKHKVWVNAGVPSGAAPTGISAGDWILDTTNNDVYWYVSGTTYIQLNQTS
jgi:hypothetical protein